MKWSVSLLAAVMLIAGAAPARADGCPEARAERLRGIFMAAEEAARKCLAASPDDVGTWHELSRALGYSGQYAEALHWVERGLERYPSDTDLSLWRIRVLAWAGRVDEARSALREVLGRVPALRADRETAMLESDLAFWSHDWQTAGEGFSSYLASWPDDADALRKRGITWLQRGDEARAESDLEAACRIAGGPGCRDLDGVRQSAARVTAMVEAAGASSARGGELRTLVGATARVVDELRIGAAGEMRMREFGAEWSTDALVHALASWRAERFALESGLAIGIDPTFSAELSGWVEPAVGLTDAVWARVRVWRLSFADGGAWVVAPGVSIESGPKSMKWSIDARYYLGVGDDDHLSHAGLLRVRWGFLPSWTLELGGGAGTGADYVDAGANAPGAVTGHALGLVGLRWSLAWNHRVMLGYTLRREVAEASLWRHEAGLTWLLSF